MNKALLALGSVVGLRFFGLFVVMPLLSVYAASKADANYQMVGLIMGAYAASQLIFQFPFGLASDKFGRKPTIIFGLIIFVAGSLVSAYATDSLWLLIGRFLQGAGSISAVTTALAADLTDESKRSKAMATIGGFIAMSFIIAMLAGPILGAKWGVNMLFELTATLGVLAALVLAFFVPTPPKYTNLSTKTTFASLFENNSLNTMYLFIFFHGFLLTNMFFILPLELVKHFGWEQSQMWQLYAPAMFLGMIAMVPSAIVSEKKGMFKSVTIIGVLFFVIGFVVCAIALDAIIFCIGGILFFIGFNMLEPILQSAASKYAKAASRGRALAMFTSFQYFGVFVGGALGGLLLSKFGASTLLWSLSIVAIVWLFFAILMSKPPLAGFYYCNISKIDNKTISSLEEMQGILDFYANEQLVTVKFDKRIIKESDIEKALLRNNIEQS